jgi:hypothetical protein
LSLSLTWVLLATSSYLPVTIGNIGVRESILIIVLGKYGVDAEKAVAIGLIMFSCQIATALIGLLYQIALVIGIAQWSPSNQR